jgi:hypothetical protein
MAGRKREHGARPESETESGEMESEVRSVGGSDGGLEAHG